MKLPLCVALALVDTATTTKDRLVQEFLASSIHLNIAIGILPNNKMAVLCLDSYP